MKTTKVLSILVVALFLGMGFAPMVSAWDIPRFPLAKEDVGSTEPVDGPDILQEPGGEGGEVKMFFRGDRMTPTRPMGNSSEEITNCPGRLFRARIMGTEIGRWSGTINADATASGSVSIAVWARSQTGAKNAGFRINLYRSGGNMQAYFTNRQDLSANPVKFTVDDTYSQTFNAGDTFDVQIIWLSDPNFFVGPSGGGEFLYGNAIFDSYVKINLNPYPLKVQNITVPEAEVSKEAMTIKADFTDYLRGDASTFIYTLFVQGPSGSAPGPEDLEGPRASAGGNTSMVMWRWNHNGNAKSGEYQLTVTVSYEGNFSVMNTSTVKVKIPGKKESGGGLLGGEGGLDFMMIGAIIAIVVIVAVVAVVLKKRKASKHDDDEEEEDD